MSNHKNLIFFNKEGDYLNFNYNNTSDRFEGDILFHENSSDTYKTVGLYTLEKVPSFEFELEGELSLNKFQLFNEYGFDFYSAKYATQSVTKIEPINNDPNFYSKWIYGVEFETRFPIGTIIKFNNQFIYSQYRSLEGIGVFNAITEKTYATIRDTISGEIREEVVEPLANWE